MIRKEIILGKYPQGLVNDEAVILRLNKIAGELLTANNFSNWFSYPYFNNSNIEDYMFFKDIELDGKEYRGVYFTKYRPYYSNREAIAINSNQLKNGYKINTMYWFIWEPIVFEIIKQQKEGWTLLSQKVMDAQVFHNKISENLDRNYLNDWESSDVRKFLNSTFYEEAFKCEHILDSKVETIDMYDDKKITIDKVFLLDSKDVINTEYGFNKGDKYNKYREKEATDYAICQGVYLGKNGKASWWLRTPGHEEIGAYRVRFDGLTGGNGEGRKINSINGIVPALRINK